MIVAAVPSLTGSCEASFAPRVISRADWKAAPPTGKGRPHVPDRITIHHTGSVYAGDPEAGEYLRLVQKYHQGDRGWIDIAYHYLIDLDGNVYEGRDPQLVGDTATDYDPKGHLSVCLIGDYETQEPTAEQLASLMDTTRWLATRYNVRAENIEAHRDHASTLCPGKNLYAHMESIIKAAVTQSK